MRVVLIILSVLAIACARGDDRQIRTESTVQSSVLAGSVSSTPARTVPSRLLDSAGKVVLSGTAQSCSGGKPPVTVGVKGISLSAFNTTKVPSLVTLLRSMDTATFPDSVAMAQFTTKYDQMVSLTNSSTALVRTTSASTGAFSVSISPIDSVLIVGFADNEGQPFYYNYKILGGRSNASFVLDMSRGDCSR